MPQVTPDGWDKVGEVSSPRSTQTKPDTHDAQMAEARQRMIEEAERHRRDREMGEERLRLQREEAMGHATTNPQKREPYPQARQSDMEVPPNVDGPVPEGFQRIPLPSQCSPYEFDHIAIRPIRVPEMMDLNSASQLEDPSWFHDILDNTLTQNIRDLWWGDYLYILTWHRIFSFTTFPFDVKVTSLYGNEITEKVESAMILRNLTLDDDDYATMKRHGLHLPTVRDAELIYNNTISDKRRLSRWSIAQYLEGKTVDEKIDRSNDVSLETLAVVRALNKAIAQAGVFEWATVSDYNVRDATKEQRKKYLRTLKSTVKTYDEQVKDRPGFTPDDEMGMRFANRVELAREAIKRLEAGEAEPVLETIYLDINELSFFPSVL